MEFFSQKQNSVHWHAYSFTTPQNRKFYGNAILFVNSGTALLTINSLHKILPKESLSLECDQNELDVTSYKIDFPTPGGICTVWVKENTNADRSQYEKQYTKDRSKIPNKRTTDAAIIEKRMKARHKGIKRNWSEFFKKLVRGRSWGDF